VALEKPGNDFIGFRILAQEAMSSFKETQLCSRYLTMQVSDGLRPRLAIVHSTANQGWNPD
jgi:hypothetical protein